MICSPAVRRSLRSSGRVVIQRPCSGCCRCCGAMRRWSATYLARFSHKSAFSVANNFYTLRQRQQASTWVDKDYYHEKSRDSGCVGSLGLGASQCSAGDGSKRGGGPDGRLDHDLSPGHPVRFQPELVCQ
ncbi:hypothetical protein PSEUDO9AZ_20974 [Pseudomonas sp. 9AZ]|nr:hypothetical protein PSEUDO9AZ_20974 [Pseudomonas sp. 9AZ]